MRRSKYLSNALSLLLVFFFFFAAFLVAKRMEKPFLFVSKQQSSLNLDSKVLDYFHFGQKRLLSSILWMATVLESDHDHYKTRDLNSWMYLRFLSISKLEPDFLTNYTFGGPYLSIIKDDLPGASDIYLRGLARYPDEFKLLQDAGFHFYYEVGNFSRALPIYEKLALHPKSTTLMISALARIKSNEGNLADAFSLLKMKYDQIDDKNSFFAHKVEENLYSLKAEMDLNCLNSKRNDKRMCATSDFKGNPYLNVRGKFLANKEWKPFRIKKRR